MSVVSDPKAPPTALRGSFLATFATATEQVGRTPRGVVLYISYMGMCRTLGYGFRAVLV